MDPTAQAHVVQGSTIHGTLKPMEHISSVQSLSHVRLFATPWTIAHQTPLSFGFYRQEYWSGLPFPSPGDLSNPRMEPGSPALQADALPSEPPGKTHTHTHTHKKMEVFRVCHYCFLAIFDVFSMKHTAQTLNHLPAMWETQL